MSSVGTHLPTRLAILTLLAAVVRRARCGDVVVGRLAGTPQLDLVMILSEAPESALARSGFGAETKWLHPVRWLLSWDPRLAVIEASGFPATGYRLTIYRPVVDAGTRGHRGKTP